MLHIACCYCGKFQPKKEMIEVEIEVVELDASGRQVQAFSCRKCLYGESENDES